MHFQMIAHVTKIPKNKMENKALMQKKDNFAAQYLSAAKVPHQSASN